MRRVTFVLPGPIERTGGFIYDGRIIDSLRECGWIVDTIDLQQNSQPLDGLADEGIVVIDGLASAALVDAIEQHARRLRIVPLVHLPLAADVTRTADEADTLGAVERRVFTAAALIVITSAATLPMLERYALPADRVVVVEPGTDRAALASAPMSSLNDSRPHLLCVATVNRGKGHRLLLEALAQVPSRQWRLTCAGSLTRDADAVADVRATIERLDLGTRVTLAGELDGDAIERCYAAADVFVLATLQETYGMAVAEAIAHGLPVISTMTGAIPRIVGTDAGLLVAPGDVDALVEALTTVITNREQRLNMAAAARRRRDLLPTWRDAAATMSVALERVVTHG